MEVTKTSDLKKLKDGEIVELPKFDDGTPFVAKLRRPSLLYLCKSGAIPNELLAAAQEIFEGKQKGNIKNYANVLDKVLEVALVEPKYEEVAELLTDVQRLAIFILPFCLPSNISCAAASSSFGIAPDLHK